MAFKRTSPQPVVEGGTGRSTLLSNGLIYGTGAGAVGSITVGTSGSLLVGATGLAPSFIIPTAGTGLTITNTSSTIQYALSTPVTVSNGGTGATSFTQNQVIIAGSTTTGNLQQVSGSSGLPLVSTGASTVPNYTALTVGGGGTGLTTSSPYTVVCGGSTPTGALQNVSGTGTSGQILTSNGAASLPTWQANNGIPNLTQYAVALGTGSPGLTSVGPNATSGIALVSQGSGANPAFSTVVVAGGGTGLTSLTSHGVVIGEGTNNVASVVGTNGQVLVGTTSADPSFVTPTVGTGLSLTTNSTTLQYGLTIPVVVSSGGTGRTTSTSYSVICGGTTTTAALQSVSGVGSSGQVLTSNGASALPTWQPSSSSTILTTRNVGSGNHTLNTNTKMVSVIIFGAGSGGGSGRRSGSTAAGGGSGGNPGNIALLWNIPVIFFGGGGAVIPYVVGSGGAGGVAQTVNNTNGNPGTAGGLCSFGNYIVNTASSDNPAGLGGTTTTVGTGGPSFILNVLTGTLTLNQQTPGNGTNTNGGSATINGNIYQSAKAMAGGGGAGADSGTARTGGNGGDVFNQITGGSFSPILAGGAGGVEGGTINGGNGNSSLGSSYFCGGTGGGGGGGQSAGGVAGIGGNGGLPGGGGGGGGGSLNGTSSGAGGAGGNGIIFIIEHL